MWPDRVSNPGSLTYESGALPTALRGPAADTVSFTCQSIAVRYRLCKESRYWMNLEYIY